MCGWTTVRPLIRVCWLCDLDQTPIIGLSNFLCKVPMRAAMSWLAVCIGELSMTGQCPLPPGSTSMSMSREKAGLCGQEAWRLQTEWCLFIRGPPVGEAVLDYPGGPLRVLYVREGGRGSEVKWSDKV